MLSCPSEQRRGRVRGPEGRVIRILQRATDTIVGTLQKTKKFFYVIPDDPRFGHDVYVRPGEAKLPGGSMSSPG